MMENSKEVEKIISETEDAKESEIQATETLQDEVTDIEICDFEEEGSGAQDEEIVPSDDDEKEFLECTVSEIYELAKCFPEENIMEDISSDTFKLFVSGRPKGKPLQIYSDYIALKKAFSVQVPEKEQLARVISGQETGTREHSGFDTYSSGRNAMCGLTKRQMEIARENGMSYREYEELLDSLPKTRMR